MRWPAFLTRRSGAPSDELRGTIAAQQQEAALAQRRAGRADRRARAERGAATKASQKLARDPLWNEQVIF